MIFLHLLYLGVLRRQIELKLKHGYYIGTPTAIPVHSNTVLYNTHSGYPTLSLVFNMYNVLSYVTLTVYTPDIHTYMYVQVIYTLRKYHTRYKILVNMIFINLPCSLLLKTRNSPTIAPINMTFCMYIKTGFQKSL